MPLVISYLQIRKSIGNFVLLGTFCLVFSLGLCEAQTASNPITEAQALIDAGKANEAFALLRPLQPRLEGEPAFDYVFGLAALDSGRTVDAIFALERVVDAFPNHGPARAELARAYLALGETDDAKIEFEKVKEMGEMPPEARQTIERYLTGIELFHDRTRLTVRRWIQAGVGYDTNVNGATDAKTLTVPIAPGLPFALGGTANSPITNFVFGASVSKPIDTDRGLSIFGSAEIGNRIAQKETDFTAQSGTGRVGLVLEKEKHRFSIAADASMSRVNGGGLARADRKSAGVSGEWQYTVTDRDQVSSFLQFSVIRHPSQSVRDIDRAIGGLNYGHAFIDIPGSPILFSSLFGGLEEEQADASGKHFGRYFFGALAGASYQISERQTASVAFTYQRSVYDGSDPIFLVRRNDEFFDLNVGYRFQFNENFSLSPTIIYNNNDSNILTSSYDRFEVMITARYDFKN